MSFCIFHRGTAKMFLNQRKNSIIPAKRDYPIDRDFDIFVDVPHNEIGHAVPPLNTRSFDFFPAAYLPTVYGLLI